MKIDLEYLIILIITIGFVCIASIANGEEYLGQVWENTTNQIREYIVDTSIVMTNDYGRYVRKNNIKAKQYCYFAKNMRTGKIIKLKMYDTLDEVITARNKGRTKKLSCRVQLQRGKSLKQQWKSWRKGKMFKREKINVLF